MISAILAWCRFYFVGDHKRDELCGGRFYILKTEVAESSILLHKIAKSSKK
jgi:hypothetical protein